MHPETVFRDVKKFESGFLPTKKNVIERTLNEDNFLKKSAAIKVAKKLIELWNWCNIYTTHHESEAERICGMTNEFSKLFRYPKSKRNGKSYKSKETMFLKDMDSLFDIICSDQTTRSKLEKQHGIKMTGKEFSFYEDQKYTRKQKCLSVVEPLTDAEVKFKKRYGFVSQLSDSPTVYTGSEAHSSLSSSHESESIT